jgi:acetylornithine deacetylase/succinyl-diaminopimelate desuccinylase-like protein
MTRRGSTLVSAVLAVLAALWAAPGAPAADLRQQVRSWRSAHEKEIVGELMDLLALPNVATRVADVEKNANHLTVLLKRRGFEVRRLTAAPGTPPALLGDLRNAAEKAAVAAMPPVEGQLRDELALGRTEGSGGRLQERLMDPALNVRGLRAAEVGEGAANAIPTEAQVSIDFRLVPDQTPQKVRDRVESFLRSQGWTLVAEAPSRETLRTHPRVARIAWSLDYPGARTDMSLPVSRAVAAVVDRAMDRAVAGSAIQVPMLGGSVPMVLFTETLKVPVIGVPIVNHDNNQHGINENLRLQNLWDGIEVFAALMAELGREWP